VFCVTILNIENRIAYVVSKCSDGAPEGHRDELYASMNALDIADFRAPTAWH